MPRKIIVGLGNPGREYWRTRHNLGFWALDLLAEKLEASWQRARYKSLLSRTQHAGWELILAKPATYMNLSGEAVSLLLENFKCSQKDLLVVCDDVNLPVGTIRIRAKGSAGGHHGLESIAESIGTNQFARIRIGIKPLERELPLDLTEFVLSPFQKGEEAIASESVRLAVNALLCILEESLEKAMSQYNR